MATPKRSAVKPPPSEMIVTPRGSISEALIAPNLRGGVVELVDGELRVRPKFARAGFRLLREFATPEQLAFWKKLGKGKLSLEDRIKHTPQAVLEMKRASRESKGRPVPTWARPKADKKPPKDASPKDAPKE